MAGGRQLGRGRPGNVAGLLALAVGASFLAFAPSVAALAASGPPLRLKPGDQVAVSGTSLRCVVSTSATATASPTLVCGVGDTTSPLPGTYALGLADSSALVLRSSSTRQPELVVGKKQPAGARTFFPAPARRAAKTFRVGSGALFNVGGTDILCAVTLQSSQPTITCGLAAKAAGTYLRGSYVGVISMRVAVLARLATATRFTLVVSKQQPAK